MEFWFNLFEMVINTSYFYLGVCVFEWRDSDIALLYLEYCDGVFEWDFFGINYLIRKVKGKVSCHRK